MTLAIILTILMAIVVYLDTSRFVIPNWLNLIILVLFPIAGFMHPEAVQWLGSLYSFLLYFAIGYAVFVLRLMGGGDIKLLAVCALWCSWGEASTMLILYTSLYGGLLTAFLLIMRPICSTFLSAEKTNFRVLRKREPVPYGIAIAAAFLTLLWTEKLSVVGL